MTGDEFNLPTTWTWPAAIGALGAGFLWLRNFLSKQSVSMQTDAATVSLISTLQAERDAAKAAAKDAYAARDAALAQVSDLRVKVEMLSADVQRLTAEIQGLRNGGDHA